jgi:hypothetical protein
MTGTDLYWESVAEQSLTQDDHDTSLTSEDDRFTNFDPLYWR